VRAGGAFAVVLVWLEFMLPGSMMAKSSRPRAASASTWANRAAKSANGLVSLPDVSNDG